MYDQNEHMPDPAMHKVISFIKSGVRIIAGISLISGSLVAAGLLLIVAELLGIYEEIV